MSRSKITLQQYTTVIVRVTNDEGTLLSFIVNTPEPMTPQRVKLLKPVQYRVLSIISEYLDSELKSYDDLEALGCRVSAFAPDEVLTIKRHKTQGNFLAQVDQLK